MPYWVSITLAIACWLFALGQVRPLVTSTAGGVDGTSMAARLREMETDYRAQAARLLVASVFPLGTVATTADVSHSVVSNSGPANPGQAGPSGPTFGSKLPGSIP
jgi:hypothetical protein